MADKAVDFFNPEDVLALGAGWEQQENNIVHSQSRAQGLDGTGDEAKSVTHDAKSAGTVVYEFHGTADTHLPPIGSVAGGYHIDGGQTVYGEVALPRVTFNVHNHDDNAHTDTLRQFTPTLQVIAGFGCPRDLGGITVPADAGVKSVTHSFGVQHLDESENGVHFAGENRDGMESLAYQFLGDQGTIAAPTSWDELTHGNVKSNVAAESGSYSWEIHSATAVPVA
jgi:hypothetical protein